MIDTTAEWIMVGFVSIVAGIGVLLRQAIRKWHNGR